MDKLTQATLQYFEGCDEKEAAAILGFYRGYYAAKNE